MYIIMSIKKLKTPLSYYVIEGLLKDPHPHYGKGLNFYLKKHNKI